MSDQFNAEEVSRFLDDPENQAKLIQMGEDLDARHIKWILDDPEVRAEFYRYLEEAVVAGQAEDELRRAYMNPAEVEAEDVFNAEIEEQTMAAMEVIMPALKRRGLLLPSQLRMKPTDDDYEAVMDALTKLKAVTEMGE